MKRYTVKPLYEVLNPAGEHVVTLENRELAERTVAVANAPLEANALALKRAHNAVKSRDYRARKRREKLAKGWLPPEPKGSPLERACDAARQRAYQTRKKAVA